MNLEDKHRTRSVFFPPQRIVQIRGDYLTSETTVKTLQRFLYFWPDWEKDVYYHYTLERLLYCVYQYLGNANSIHWTLYPANYATALPVMTEKVSFMVCLLSFRIEGLKIYYKGNILILWLFASKGKCWELIQSNIISHSFLFVNNAETLRVCVTWGVCHCVCRAGF